MNAKIALALDITKHLAAAPGRHGADSRDEWAADVVADAAALVEAFGAHFGGVAPPAGADPYAAVWLAGLAEGAPASPGARQAPARRPPVVVPSADEKVSAGGKPGLPL